MKVGILPPVGFRWFRTAGDMAPSLLSRSCKPSSGRGLSSSGPTAVLADASACTGTNKGLSGAGPSRPSRAWRRHVNSRHSQTPWRAATARIIEPGSLVSATIRTLSCRLHRRRRSGPVMISTTPSINRPQRRLNELLKSAGGSIPGGPRRTDTVQHLRRHRRRVLRRLERADRRTRTDPQHRNTRVGNGGQSVRRPI